MAVGTGWIGGINQKRVVLAISIRATFWKIFPVSGPTGVEDRRINTDEDSAKASGYRQFNGGGTRCTINTSEACYPEVGQRTFQQGCKWQQ